MSKTDPSTDGDRVVNIDLRQIYDFSPDDIVPDITSVRYSNLAYINCAPRDIFIDFLEIPGIKKDGKMMLNGTRIYMSHAAAQKLSEALKNILENANLKGDLETYQQRSFSSDEFSPTIKHNKTSEQV